MVKLQIREATSSDVKSVLEIVNAAYRTEGGWTTESHLIVGDRLVEADFVSDLNDKNKLTLIASDGKLDVACVQLTKEESSTHIGMLSVLPDMQNKGYASELLDYAETLAKSRFHATEVNMLVLDVRKELLAFYHRRGYQRVDEYQPFPLGLNVGKPIDQNLMLEKIVKPI